MTTRLVLEYVLDGHKRGYNFTTATGPLDDAALRAIWRGAMPRGQGWNAPDYAGAHSLKCFPVGDGVVAVSDVMVTEMRDENGRGGIRRAVIDVLSQGEYRAYLEARLATLPGDLHARLADKPSFGQRIRIIERALPWFGKEQRLILSHPYHMADWRFIEALVIKLALNPVGPMRRWAVPLSFTSLALEHRDEAQIVAIPAARLAGAPVRTVSI